LRRRGESEEHGPATTTIDVPKPCDNDSEDVHWALSAAATCWKQGEADEALKWLRRAATEAAEHDDTRAVELFKAAADVANHLDGLAEDEAAAVTVIDEAADITAVDEAAGDETAGARATRDKATAKKPRRRNRVGLVFDESEEETFIRPETALRRALLRIDPDYARRVDLPPGSELRGGRVVRAESPEDSDSELPESERPELEDYDSEQHGLEDYDSEQHGLEDYDSEQHDPEQPRRTATRREGRNDGPERARPRKRSRARLQYQTLEDEHISGIAAPALHPEELGDDEASEDPNDRTQPRAHRAGLPSGALPTLRVAVLPLPDEGDVRILFLPPGAEPPPGVASALLVPTTVRDAQLLARVYDESDAKL